MPKGERSASILPTSRKVNRPNWLYDLVYSDINLGLNSEEETWDSTNEDLKNMTVV